MMDGTCEGRWEKRIDAAVFFLWGMLLGVAAVILVALPFVLLVVRFA